MKDDSKRFHYILKRYFAFFLTRFLQTETESKICQNEK